MSPSTNGGWEDVPEDEREALEVWEASQQPRTAKCPACLRTGRRSIVTVAGRSQGTTGKAGIASTTYKCTCGHFWSEADAVKPKPEQKGGADHD